VIAATTPSGSRSVQVNESGSERQRVAVRLGDEARVVAEHLRRHRDLDLARVEQRLAGVLGLELAQLVGVRVDQLAELVHELARAARRHAPPGGIVERLARGLDREVHVSTPPIATRALMSSVAGLMVSKVLPLEAARHSLPIKSFNSGVVMALAFRRRGAWTRSAT
jgi:hypothetical protein